MKKFITAAALLAAGTALSNAAVTFTDSATLNYNSTMHGFQFTLSALSTTETIDAGTQFALDSLSIRNPGSANTGVGVTFALVALNLSDNTVLGYTTDTATTRNAGTTSNTFSSFTAVGGGDLVLTYDTTYRFLTVSTSVIEAITSAGESVTSILYAAGGTGNVQTSLDGATLTISNGLTAPGTRGHYDTSVLNPIIAGADGQNLYTNSGNYIGSVVSSVTATAIPEPSAFGLLAGAGALALVAARRRRRAK